MMITVDESLYDLYILADETDLQGSRLAQALVDNGVTLVDLIQIAVPRGVGVIADGEIISDLAANATITYLVPGGSNQIELGVAIDSSQPIPPAPVAPDPAPDPDPTPVPDPAPDPDPTPVPAPAFTSGVIRSYRQVGDRWFAID